MTEFYIDELPQPVWEAADYADSADVEEVAITAPEDGGSEPFDGTGDIADLPPPDETGDLAPEPEEPRHPVVEGMDNLRASEVLGDEATRDEAFHNADTGAVKQMLNAVNGTVRGLPSERWGMDGRGYIETDAELLAPLTDYDPPAPEDREPLLDEAIEAAKDLPAEHAGTLTGLAINATHVWNDGCGRTSRFAYTARTHGYDGSSADAQMYSDLLANTEGREVVNLDTSRMGLPASYARESRQEIAAQHDYDGALPTYNWGGYNAFIVDDEGPDTLMTKPEIPESDRQDLHSVVQDSTLGSNALMQHVLDTGRDPSQYLRTSPDGERHFVDMDKLAPDLSSDDIAAIVQKHGAIKREYVEDLIDTFTNPERQERAQEIVDFYRPAARR